MQELMVTAYGQMRLVTGFETIKPILSVLLIAGTAGVSWAVDEHRVGSALVAAATRMAFGSTAFRIG